jgi:Amt family ammonium transporter
MIDAGNTAWLITATALVLFMTLPGLALFMEGWSAPRTCSPS